MSERITLPCSNGFVLHAEGGTIIISTKKQDETIPISQIQSFALKEPGLAYGTVSFKTAQAASAGVSLGFGISAALGAERKFFYEKADVELARRFRDYVTGYSDQPQAQPTSQAGTVVSVVDEIRGLKGLLDDGIITQAEFDAKKAQLLGL